MVWAELADIVRKVDWAKWGELFVVTGVKALCKVALNKCSDGLGVVVDIIDAAHCFNKGDDPGGAINILSAIAGISMDGPGTVGSSTEAMTLAKFALNSGLSVISSGGHQILETVGEDWIHRGITEALRRKPMEVAFDLTKGSVKQGARAEFLKDLGFALVKGSIRIFHPDNFHYGNNGLFDLPELRRISESYESRNNVNQETIFSCLNLCMFRDRP